MDTPLPTLSPTATIPTSQPSTTSAPLFPVFLYGARPLSLDASLIAADPLPDEPNKTLWRLQLACPTGTSSSSSGAAEDTEDADDQCARAGLFPAELYHTQGSVYGGTYTPQAAAATTWRCELGGSTGDEQDPLSGDCSQWETEGASSTTTTRLGQCDVLRHSVPVRVTDGAAKETYYYLGTTWSPDRYNSEVVAAELSSLACPDPTSLVDFGGAAAAVTSISASSSSSSTGAAASGTGSASASGADSSGGAAAPTESASAGVASRGERAGLGDFVCVALACASVAGLLTMPPLL
ncbi:hypothetical protein Daus18300_001012 [Diaporthe australafricana]|uniref:Uncharacterized protein n=1 Tax=Diaporthe australafricana TaxID=127596 RepID=A0ABR3Y1M9_9PEZI